jgi:hypothetical protein
MSRALCTLRWHRSALAAVLVALAGCSTPGADPPATHHAYELALAWAAGASTDTFHFPISCPGPEKLVLFKALKFELRCNAKEHIDSTPVDTGREEPAAEPAAAPAKLPSLDCYLVVVPAFKDVAGVLTDMRRGIEARRTGPVDCALVRYR